MASVREVIGIAQTSCGGILIEPLRKQTRDGKLYKRVGEIETKLVELAFAVAQRLGCPMQSPTP